MYRRLSTFGTFVAILAFFLVAFSDPGDPDPPGPMGAYLNGIFPESTPGANGAWQLEEALPDMTFDMPVRILPFPDSEDLLLLNKSGEIWRLNINQQTRALLFDIKQRAFRLGDAGAVGMALHPRFGDPFFPDKQLLYFYYRTKPEPDAWSEQGFNRLSVFQWNAQLQQFDPNTERVLFQQYDRSTWHNGGAMFFGKDGFLYLSVGDEGHEEYLAESNQRLDGGLFGGILRIDVDKNPERSHPIRRQPLANAAAPSGWGPTYSQDYYIPNDNPWQSPEGEQLEEFYSIGLRSPYGMTYDPATEAIWVADVGSAFKEEINLVEKGDNHMWPYFEGTEALDHETLQERDQLLGVEKSVFFEYDRTFGACVIGGIVYRGTRFPALRGKYLFADFNSNKIMALNKTGSQAEPELEVLIDNLGGQPIDLPEGPGITGVFESPDGEVYVTVIGSRQQRVPGRIYRLVQRTTVPDPPARLSELGVFSDLENLVPIDGIIPYQVNSPLWSDRATKKRWLVLPNDGRFDRAEEQITFDKDEAWRFPEGTVFIKHFDLPLTDDPNGPSTKLETRFFVIAKEGGAYGLTYKWNDAGTEAYLLGGGDSRNIAVNAQEGRLLQQTWDYPSRGQCMSCHNANADYVLGVKTHQLNSELYYPKSGETMNQIDYLNRIGAFRQTVRPAQTYERSYAIDDPNAALDIRVLSYFDANCAPCHRIGGLPELSMDLRLSKPLFLKNITNVSTQSHASTLDKIVQPGDHTVSELWVRDASQESNRMPPIGRNLVDQPYLDALAEWIDGLPAESGKITQHLLFPNPTSDWLGVKINDEWPGPFQIQVYTLSGRLVQRLTTNDAVTYLDLRNQSAGIYLLELKAGQERSIERFVLQ
ncbi:MAG TPA: PQQ-dependent sugar dehydrogenase [Saprospiraceae bacterium]|nr:PQQ-dependent sugar dehydrogenase [Saprospiraceae bacterium]